MAEEREIVPVEAYVVELEQDLAVIEAREQEYAGIMIRVVHGAPGVNVIDTAIVNVIGNRDLLRMADAELVGLAEDYLHEQDPATWAGRGVLGKVDVYRPTGENVVIGPPAGFGLRSLDDIEAELKAGPTSKGSLYRIATELLEHVKILQQNLFAGQSEELPVIADFVE